MVLFVDYSEKERRREGLCEDNRKMHTIVPALRGPRYPAKESSHEPIRESIAISNFITEGQTPAAGNGLVSLGCCN